MNEEFKFKKETLDLSKLAKCKDYVFDYEINNILKRNLFKDSLKKILLFHVVFYGKPLKLKSILVSKDDNDSLKVEIPNVYYMFENANFKKMSNLKSRELILQKLSKQSYNDVNPCKTSLLALVTAESKNNNTEKFLYLWIAFNAFYNQMAQVNKKQRNSERAKISSVLSRYGYGTNIFGKESGNSALNRMNGIISKWDSEYNLEDEHNAEFCYSVMEMIRTVNEKSSEKNQSELELFGYLLGDYAYRIRCKYFHGERAIKIISFEGDYEIRIIKLAISVIESFMFEHLIDMLNEN